MGDEQLFRRVADRGRVVQHQGPRLDMLQHMGRGDIGHVEGRVLAHHHQIEARQVDPLARARREMIAAFAPHGKRPRGGAELIALQHKLTRQIVEQVMSALQPFQRHHEAGIGIDIDRFQRVHLERDIERHGVSLILRECQLMRVAIVRRSIIASLR